MDDMQRGAGMVLPGMATSQGSARAQVWAAVTATPTASVSSNISSSLNPGRPQLKLRRMDAAHSNFGLGYRFKRRFFWRGGPRSGRAGSPLLIVLPCTMPRPGLRYHAATS
eukprot:1815189-Rhodomonas_salina.1